MEVHWGDRYTDVHFILTLGNILLKYLVITCRTFHKTVFEEETVLVFNAM